MPMLHFSRDGNDGAGSHLNWSLAPFLIPTTTCDANQHLYLFVVDVPVITATRFERNIHDTAANVCQIALTNEVLTVRIWLALRPLGAQGIALIAEPCAELIDQLLRVAHVHGTLLVSGELWSNAFEATQGCYGNYLTIGSSELVTSEDITKEVRLQVVVVLRAEGIVERLS